MSRLRGKRSCITGGGGAPGLAFAREGAAVAVVDVVADAAEQTVRLVVEGPTLASSIRSIAQATPHATG